MASTSSFSLLGVAAPRSTVRAPRVRHFYPPLDRSLYSSPIELYDSIRDWEALRCMHYAKALGRRGGRLNAQMLHLKAMREAEVQSLLPPPLAQAGPATTYEDFRAVADYEDDDDVLDMTVPHQAPAPMPHNGNDNIQAASQYIQQVGNASSAFMLAMTSATQVFVQQQQQVPALAPAPAPAPGPTPVPCAICFEVPTAPMMGTCSHVFCRACLMHERMGTRVIQQGDISALLVKKCPNCRRESLPFYKMLA